MQIFFAESYLPANSISEMMCIPFSFMARISGTVSGIPGLFTTSSALRIFSIVCPPSSHWISHLARVALASSLIFPLSLKNTSNPLTLARTAEPMPLSPPPSTTTRCITDYLIFSVIIVIAQSKMVIIQNLTTILASGMAFFGVCMIAGIPSFWKWW